MYLRRQFLQSIGQTNPSPHLFEISRAEGCYLYDKKNKAYLDLVSGFSVNNLGHRNREVIQAIQEQSELYLHTSVYGEHVQSPQIKLANLLRSHLPEGLQQVYFLNTGSETIDAAIKLCRAYTGRAEIVVCRRAYHGSTLGAESLRSDFEHKQEFLPLIPGIRFIDFNSKEDLEMITVHTSCVITEVVQAEAGIQKADAGWLQQLRKKCDEVSSLLVFDEIQTGMGRTGSLFAFQQYAVVPDILLLGKAFGAGLPLAGLVADRKILSTLSHQTSLSYISTFGGNPLSCAAGLAGLQYIIANKLCEQALAIGQLFKGRLAKLHYVKVVRQVGLFLALELKESYAAWPIIQLLYEEGVLVEGFLFCHNAIRITPPLILESRHIDQAMESFLKIR